MTNLNREALDLFLDDQVGQYHIFDYKISRYYKEDNRFKVKFTSDNHNDVIVRVLKIDKDDLEMSQFEVHVHDDVYEAFNLYDYSLAEFWKAVLWQL